MASERLVRCSCCLVEHWLFTWVTAVWRRLVRPLSGGWNGLPVAGAGWARCWVSEGTGDGASEAGAGPGTSAGLGPVVTVVAAGLVPSVS
jgi:hypothetical protein